MKGKLHYCIGKGCLHLKVSGFADFELSAPFRQYAAKAHNELSVDLSECSGLDSTFLGIMTLVALDLRQEDTRMIIRGCDEVKRREIKSLGLESFFTFQNESAGGDWHSAEDGDDDGMGPAPPLLKV